MKAAYVYGAWDVLTLEPTLVDIPTMDVVKVVKEEDAKKLA